MSRMSRMPEIGRAGGAAAPPHATRGPRPRRVITSEETRGTVTLYVHPSLHLHCILRRQWAPSRLPSIRLPGVSTNRPFSASWHLVEFGAFSNCRGGVSGHIHAANPKISELFSPNPSSPLQFELARPLQPAKPHPKAPRAAPSSCTHTATKMPLPFGVYRADHVGSFLRPKSVLAAREAVANDQSSLEDLRKVEDKAISKVAAAQLANGLRSITDGEFRRAYFHLDFLQHLSGIEIKGQTGLIRPHGFSPPVLAVTGKLGHARPIQVEDFKFLEQTIKEHGGAATAKVCIPSPTMVHFRGGRASIDIEAYPDLDDFFEDLARVYQEELASLYAAGCRFVQLDDTNLAYLCDPDMRRQAEQDRNEDLSTLPRRYAELINAAISKRPADMKIGIHLCRGNYRSKWFASGGYEPVAEVLFKELNVDAYFLEYDDARSGDFKPLRHLPEHKVVVLGLMSSKKSGLDDKEEILTRLKQAAEIAPRGLEQLCLSHQCGFSSTVEGNELSEEEQWAKVRLEVEIAEEVWGKDLSK